MASEDEVRAALRWQADYCRRNGSPLTGLICDAVATALDHETETGRAVLGWAGDPTQDALPLRIAGGIHALHRGGWAPELGPIYRGEMEAPDEVSARVATIIAEHDGQIRPWLEGPPQTNEPGRAAVLMAGLLAVAAIHPRITGFELIEIGSSAGLNLMIGRYAHELGGVAVGPADSPLRLAPEWRGPPPPDTPRWIESVRGVDIAPIDLGQDLQAERLLAYIWADQTDRLERTARAIAMAQERPPRLDHGDAAVWLKERLKEPQAEGQARVLMHSVVWPYLPKKTQLTIEALMTAARGRATETKPLVWLAYEWTADRGSHQLSLRSWPGLGLERVLAYAHPHGAWIDWLSSSPRGR
jgi:hypothetical protein